MKRWLPEYVTTYKDRHGKARYRFRKSGLPTYNFKNEPGTPEFLAELHHAQNATKPAPEPRYEAGTVDAVIAALYASPKWKAMKPTSKRTYRSILERFREGNGHRQISSITTAKIDKKLGAMADTPIAANNLRKTLSKLFKQAAKMGLIDHDPVKATDAYRQTGDGFHTWTEEEIAAYEAYWPIGTRERLAMALLLHTALRRSDMIKLTHESRVGNRLVLVHGKNESDTDIPINPELAAAMAPFEGGTGTYLQTVFGKPYTADGFGNWFRRKIDEAGLPKKCAAHGLRKAMSRRLAESGSTNQQGRSITGHKTDREFTRYANRANKAGMADDAMANLVDKFAKKDAGDAE